MFRLISLPVYVNRSARHIAARESLMYARKVYNPDLSETERESRVDEVVESLGLESCQDTKVSKTSNRETTLRR